ncbi:MAG TPA: T9SS type A sorting domain-containing protein [Flavobacterium sp.]|nr:T9SS type A sorting domain-containing protein [Flavobacterium sp.]
MRILLLMLIGLSGFAQQLHRQTFHGGVSSNPAGISLVGETFNRTSPDQTIRAFESILYREMAGQLDVITPVGHQLVVFPNPTLDELNIVHPSVSSWQLELFDAAGKLVFQDEVSDTFSIGQLPPGFYLARFVSDSRSATLKILKK